VARYTRQLTSVKSNARLVSLRVLFGPQDAAAGETPMRRSTAVEQPYWAKHKMSARSARL